MIKGLFGVLLVLMPVAVSAKEFNFPIFTKADPTSPVTMRGTLTGDDNSPDAHEFYCSAHLTIANTSEKPILVLITEVRATAKEDGIVSGQLDEIGIDDYFFLPELFLAKATQAVDMKMFPQKQLPNLPITSVRKVTGEVKVLFVQFADGSTWGDPRAAINTLQSREQAWKQLKQIADLYHSNDRKKFVAALSEPAAQGPYLGKLAVIYQKTQSIESVAQEMETLLKLGNARLSAMSQVTAATSTAPN